jgi:hypothetical protein
MARGAIWQGRGPLVGRHRAVPGDYDECITMPAFGEDTMVIGGFKNVYGL